MAFGIMRMTKHSSAGSISAADDHNERLRETPNADKELRAWNARLVGSSDLLADVNNRLAAANITPRANAVLAVEFILTASPEFFDYKKIVDADGKVKLSGNVANWKGFQEATLNWLNAEFGADNVVKVVVHKDERTPHIHAFVVPIVEKEVSTTRQRKNQPQKEQKTVKKARLAAKDLFGQRQQMRDLQSRFSASVHHLGLQRGIEGSVASHTTVKEFYAFAKSTADPKQNEAVKIAQEMLQLRGNRKKDKELIEMRAGLKAAGLTMYHGKVITLVEYEKVRQKEQKASIKPKLSEKAEPTHKKATVIKNKR